MSENDRIVLKAVLAEQKATKAPELSDNTYFEIFTAEHILKNFDLSYDEILSGQVGAGGDGGIDAMYMFVNGNLIEDDTDISSLGRDIKIELFIIQSKMETGFGEDAIRKFDTTVKDLFDLSKDLAEFTAVYNENLLRLATNFRDTYTQYAARLPSLVVNFRYVTIGDDVHPNVKRLVSQLKTTVLRLFSSATFSFDFINAANLLALTRQLPRTTFNLRLAESPISSGEESFICLVNLAEFYHFISDDDGRLRRSVFEANVRDYQGNVQVNKGIRDTLFNPTEDDFWWLNNGVTIIASRVSLSGKTLNIMNPLIVNGLQTSYEIHSYLSFDPTRYEERNILVRVIGVAHTADEAQTRNRIIKATNSQTAIQVASLRATDNIQRDIEDYLRSEGLYYDRRKNYYKNEGRPISKIISITYLAQSVIAILLKRPNDARARPSSLLKEDSNYYTIFDPNHTMPLYLRCIQIMKRIESYLIGTFPEISSLDVNNFKFHLAMYSSLLLANNPEATHGDILALNLDDFTVDFLNDCFSAVAEVYSAIGNGSYYASKDRQSVLMLLERLRDITYRGN
jgi:hypothetical protein